MVDVRAKGAKAETEYLYSIRHNTFPIIYFGITNDIKRRFREHKRESSNSLLKHYIETLGIEEFTFSIIATEISRAAIEELETLVIEEAKNLDRLIVCNKLLGSVTVVASCQVGTDHWNARFNDQDIINIRKIYATGGITQKKLGEIYSCSNKVISKITRGDRWKHIDAPITKNLLINKVANRRKLTDKQVIELRSMAKEEYEITGTLDIPTIADLAKVSRGNMRMLLKGEVYPNLGGPILKIDYYKDFGR